MTARGVMFAVSVFLLTADLAIPATHDGSFKPSPAEHNAMLRELDQVFGWAAVQRLSDLQQLSCGDSNGYAICSSKVSLRVDGAARTCTVEFDGTRHKLGLASFIPHEPVPPELMKQDFYTPDRDTLKDPKQRAFAIAAVAKFNSHLRWHWFSGPSIHREGRNLLVTYHVFSDAEEKRRAYAVSTLLTFYVSPRGAICGAVYSE